MLRRAAFAAAAFLLTVVAARAAAPRFWRLEGTPAFLKGELENLSLDSEGRLQLGPRVQTVFDPEAPNAWCVASDEHGVLYVGTGNEGRVYRVEGEEGRLLFDADELEVYAVAVGPEGRVYAATSPEGAVHVVEADGSARPFYDPPEPYIWALAFDGDGNLLVSTGGGEGRVYRVRPDGVAETLLSSAETHVLSLAIDERGRIFAGSSPEGIVYRIDPAGKVFVVLDSPYREIKALAVGADGAVYAAAVNGGPAPPPAAPATPPVSPAEASAPVAQVTVTESFAVVAPPGATPEVTPGPSPAPSTAPRGALLRIGREGTVERLWTSSDDVPHALASTGGGVLVGTGDKGKLYRVRGEGAWTLLASVGAQQITGLVAPPGRPVALVTSNPARAARISEDTADEGAFVSAVNDAEAVAAWGRLSWEGTVPEGTELRLETRSGNTSTPDATWAPWAAASASPPSTGKILSESARYLQIRLTLVGRDGATPEVEAVSAAYLQQNLRPRVSDITVHPPGQVFQKPISVSGDPEILGLEPERSERPAADQIRAPSTPVTAFSRQFHQRGLRTFTWTAEDPNGDNLVYDVEYRALGDAHWRPLREGLAEPVLAWDTTAVPDGRYLVRVTASDAPDNPPARALASHNDSTSFQVDNAPPSLTASIVGGARGETIRAVARDEGSPIRRLEISVDAGPWQEAYPTDGINDSKEEVYELPLPAGSGPGPHVVVLRVSDRLGNVASSRVDVP